MTRKRSNTAEKWIGVQHLRIRSEVVNSPAWRALSWSARSLYIDLRANVNSVNNGTITATLSNMKHRGWRSSATLAKALHQLRLLGFIATTRQGGIAAMSRTTSLYRFTDLPVLEFPKQGITAGDATFDYREFKSVREARAVVSDASQNNSKVQKLKHKGSETEAMALSTASKTEAEGPSKVQKLKQAGTDAGPGITGREANS